MFALCLGVAAGFADPVMVVQLRYPAHRIAIVTGSSYQVYYSLPQDAPIELRRAYKILEAAERDVLLTEALQLFKAEMVANERRLEALRTARLAEFLTNTAARNKELMYIDPALNALAESQFKVELGRELAYDSRVERAIGAIERLTDAQLQLRQAVLAIAFPNAADRPVVEKGPGIEVVRIGKNQPVAAVVAPVAAANRPAAGQPAAAPRALTPVEMATRAEEVAAAAELRAELRERNARANERAADAYYRDCEPEERAEARAVWVQARDEWQKAKRDWDDARTKWQTARDRLEAVRAAASKAAPPAAPDATRVVSTPKPSPPAPAPRR
jgi:hypothetical protein